MCALVQETHSILLPASQPNKKKFWETHYVHCYRTHNLTVIYSTIYLSRHLPLWRRLLRVKYSPHTVTVYLTFLSQTKSDKSCHLFESGVRLLYSACITPLSLPLDALAGTRKLRTYSRQGI